MAPQIVTVRINNDLNLIQRIRDRYQRVINDLQSDGFVYLISYSETQIPYSLLLLTPIYLTMRSHAEILKITSPLRVSAFYPLLIHRETGTVALINGLNTKFYTLFTDSTAIISVNSETKTIFDVKDKLYKASFPGSELGAWQKHQEWMAGFIKEGKQPKVTAGFEDYCAMSIREDSSTVWDLLGLIVFWLAALVVLAGMLFLGINTILNLFSVK